MKIALCISGESRDFNKFHAPETIITRLMEKGHHVDVFGHTWTHCDIPNSTDVINFKDLLIEDQDSIISKWVLEDPEKRGWPGDYNSQEEMLERTKARCGQHVSGIKCLQMPNTDDYDVFIRWRWDLMISDNLQKVSDEFLDMHYHPWFDFVKDHEDPVALTSCNSWITPYYPSIEDTHYFFNKHAHKEIKQMNILKNIEFLWTTADGIGYVSFHTLWNYLLLECARIHIGTQLPNITCFEPTWIQKDDILI